jgi:hypothetical protein
MRKLYHLLEDPYHVSQKKKLVKNALTLGKGPGMQGWGCEEGS